MCGMNKTNESDSSLIIFQDFDNPRINVSSSIETDDEVQVRPLFVWNKVVIEKGTCLQVRKQKDYEYH